MHFFLHDNQNDGIFFSLMIVKVMISVDSGDRPTISGGPLSGTYEFSQLHFHWGQNDTIGSEDLIDGHRYVFHWRNRIGCELQLNAFSFTVFQWNCIWCSIRSNIETFDRPWKTLMV